MYIIPRKCCHCLTLSVCDRSDVDTDCCVYIVWMSEENKMLFNSQYRNHVWLPDVCPMCGLKLPCLCSTV